MSASHKKGSFSSANHEWIIFSLLYYVAFFSRLIHIFFLSGRQKFEFLFYAFIVVLVSAELFATFSVVFSANRLNQIIKNSMNSQYFRSYQIRTEKLWILLIKNVGMPQLFSRQLFVDSTMF